MENLDSGGSMICYNEDVFDRDSLPYYVPNVLSLLPEEVWILVLAKLERASDLWNCYHTSPIWSYILEHDKCTWQFHLAFPYLFKYLPKNDILKCRKVCHTWQKTVDSFLEEGQFQLYNSSTNYRVRKLVELTLGEGNRLEDQIEGMERFRLEMKNWTKNPIVSRSVSMSQSGNLYMRPFFRDFGVHVWHTNLFTVPDEGTSVDFAQYLFDILQYTPNLRSFQILGIIMRNDEREPDPGLEVEALQRFLVEHPLPPMPQLHRLDIRLQDSYTNDQTAEAIYNAFLSAYASQIQQLYHMVSAPFPNPMCHLKDLSIKLHSSDQLANLGSLSSPLEVLDLIIHTTELNPRRLFRTIENFRSTLNVLSVRFFSNHPRPMWFGKSVQFPSRVSLPYLKRLHLEDISARSDISWDFLRDLRSLRRLEVMFKNYTKIDDVPRRRERVLINHYLDEYGRGTEFGMYFSNIWHLLPDLEKITLWRISHSYRRVFSREYQEYIHEQFRKRLFPQTEEF